MEKFCKCAEGTYGDMGVYDTVSYLDQPGSCAYPYIYENTGDNQNWATGIDSVCRPASVYVILCNNNRFYYVNGAYSYPAVNYSVSGHGKKCWDSSWKYLRETTGAGHSSSSSKFCKCAMGTYGETQTDIVNDFPSTNPTLTSYVYSDGSNDLEWMTTRYIHQEHTAIDKVMCLDGKWYPTNKDYYSQ